jgi:hypothetical protein
MRSILTATTLGMALLVAGCQNTSSIVYGDANSIIIAAPESLWSAIDQDVRDVLEPPFFAVRNERAFEVTHVAPTEPEWGQLRLWRQVVILGHEDDPWMEPFVGRGDAEEFGSVRIVERESVWARGQRVTAVVLPAADEVEAVREALPTLYERFDERFRQYVMDRMYASGVNIELRDQLREEANFSLTPPNVYRHWTTDGPVHVFVNDQSGRNQLIRAILVTWREGTEAPSVEEALAWRDGLMEPTYGMRHLSQPEPLRTAALEGRAEGSVEIRGGWDGTDEDGFPLAGPFLTRVVVCPEQNRTYLMDAWLYAPSVAKREYMLQLETIFDTFECGS